MMTMMMTIMKLMMITMTTIMMITMTTMITTSMIPEGRGRGEGEKEDGVRCQSPSMRSSQRCGLQYKK